MENIRKEFLSDMGIELKYLEFGFRRAEIFDFLKRKHGMNLEPTAAPIATEPSIPEWANRRQGLRRFTLKQAAFALSGVDPMHGYSVQDEARADVNAVSTALYQAIEDGFLVAVDTAEEYGEDVSVLAVQDLKQWADSHGYWWPIPLPPALDPAISTTPAPVPSKTTAPTVAPEPSPPPAVAPTTPDLDPTDLPEELDAANMAFRAVFNGYGNPADTFRNRLIEYLKTTYPELIDSEIERIATVANPDKTRGRKKKFKE